MAAGWQSYKWALLCWQGPGALLFVHHVLVAFGIQQVGELARVVQLDAEQPAGAVGVGVDQLGYTVLAARTPGEAMRLAREHSGSIDLLITDVVMPEMNGRDLAGNLLALYPGMKCLFMSGYTANVIAHHGVLEEGVHFLEKPFLMTDLAANIRKALGQ